VAERKETKRGEGVPLLATGRGSRRKGRSAGFAGIPGKIEGFGKYTPRKWCWEEGGSKGERRRRRAKTEFVIESQHGECFRKYGSWPGKKSLIATGSQADWKVGSSYAESPGPDKAKK